MELPPGEERRLLNLSVIPAAVVTYVLLIVFIYITYKQQSLSLAWFLIYFGMPLAFAMPTMIFLSYEILVSRKTGMPLRSHVKRLAGRISMLLLGLLIFLSLLVSMYAGLVSRIGELAVLLLAGTTWFAVWITLVLRLRKLFDKLYRGQW